MKRYNSPWSTTLIVVSSLTTIVCLVISLGLIPVPAPIPFGEMAFLVRMLPIVLLIGASLFTIRGYSITDQAILVHRLFWVTKIPLANLQSATSEPNAMKGSLRICGNGGAFSFTGYYRNKTLGSYRAYVTDLARSVVLRFPDRTIVLSPDEPESFVNEIKAGKL